MASRIITTLSLSVLLAACGGGGSGTVHSDNSYSDSKSFSSPTGPMSELDNLQIRQMDNNEVYNSNGGDKTYTSDFLLSEKLIGINKGAMRSIGGVEVPSGGLILGAKNAIRIIPDDTQGAHAKTLSEAQELRLPGFLNDLGVLAANRPGSGISPKLARIIGYFDKLPQALGGENQEDITAVYLRDPVSTGFKYQTFGEVKSSSTSELVAAYVTIGNRFTPAENMVLDASYQGVSMGQFKDIGTDGSWLSVAADMTAQLKFGPDEKALTVTIDNQVMLDKTSTQESRPVFQKVDRLAFTEKLDWDAQANAFTKGPGGKEMTAYLYGPNAEEVGGTFNRQLEQGAYQGAFGGSR